MGYIPVFAAVMSLIVCINYKYTPKEPSFYGYKTKRSTTNRDTWLYANRVVNALLLLKIAIFIILAFILLYGLNLNEEKAL